MKQENQWKAVDQLRRLLFVKYELKRYILKSIYFNCQIKPHIRLFAYYKLQHLPKFILICKHKNRCLVSGRTHFVYSKLKLSRLQIYKNLSKGALCGAKHLIW